MNVDKKAADKKADVKPVSNVPKTGDTSHAGVWVMLMTAAVLSGILCNLEAAQNQIIRMDKVKSQERLKFLGFLYENDICC